MVKLTVTSQSIANPGLKASLNRPAFRGRARPFGRTDLTPGSGVVGAENDSGHLFAEKIGHELLMAGIAVKVNFIVQRRIIMHHFRYHFIFGATKHDDFIGSHGEIITTSVPCVEL